ncbi:MmgE/PrpD family protein [Conexibacter sp. DBS9H8]|uniref:MmgE/PrpD family protein n=1 Tax=Conexibacter sp. DBS9H8 TaxID=2937801 RepID=UPI002112B59C|nr:MmgE/PrpD family protein [Conexibacter sp. DBS9H8]
MSIAPPHTHTPTEILAQHVLSGIHADQLSDETVQRAGSVLLDAIANGLFGATQDAVQMIDSEVRARYRRGSAISWASGADVHPAGAANINAAGAHGFEFDDYLPAGKTHVGAVIAPVILALADDKMTGHELLETLVAAYDVMGRVSIAAGGSSVRSRGWHITGLVGPFGATAAAGRLLRLDAEQLARAFGVAASTAAGTFSFSAEGAMTKCFHAGRAAEAGILAASLGKRGFKGPLLSLDAADGGLLSAISDAPRFGELTRDLGHRFDLDSVAIKPYPCCGSAHSSIDALLALRERHGLEPHAVTQINVANAESVLLQCGYEYSGNGGRVEAQMSLQFCLAAALADGDVTVQHFLGKRPADPDLLSIAGLVTFEHDAVMDRIYPAHFPTRVTVSTEGGETFQAEVEDPKGSRACPMTRADVERKAATLLEHLVDPELSTQLTTLTRDLRDLPNVGQLKRVIEHAVTAR